MATKSAYEKVFGEFQKIIMKTTGLEGQFAFQFNIEGEVEDGAGAFFMKFADGVLSVEPYDYTDNDAVFKASAETFRKLLTGKLDPSEAIASGELKVENTEYQSTADIFKHIAANQGAKKETAKEDGEKAAEKKAEAPAEAKPAEKKADSKSSQQRSGKSAKRK